MWAPRVIRLLASLTCHGTARDSIDLASQDDGLGRSPMAPSLPLSDGCPPPATAGDDGKKLTSLASVVGLPKIDTEAELGDGETPGEVAYSTKHAGVGLHTMVTDVGVLGFWCCTSSAVTPDSVCHCGRTANKMARDPSPDRRVS